MSAPSVTHTFANSTTADATQVNTNFTDLINAMTDGSADFTIGSISVAGAATFNGAVTLGNATSDDITVTGSLASNLVIKTNATYGIGSSTSGLSGIYLGNGANKTTRIIAGTVGTSWTFTLPNDVPTITGQTFVFNTSGTAEFRYPDKFTASKTGDYTATGDETVIPCAPSASMTVTLPAASTCTGKVLTIIKTDTDISKTVTIDANSTETILPSLQSSSLTYILYTQYESVTLKCNGTSWYLVANYTKTDMTSFTPTLSGGGFGTPTNIAYYWFRNGNRVRIVGTHTNGTVAGSVCPLPLPSNMTIDTTRVTLANTTAAAGQRVGIFTNGGASSAAGPIVTATGTSSSQVYLGGLFSQTTMHTPGNGSTNCSTSGTVSIDFEVPVSGWNP